MALIKFGAVIVDSRGTVAGTTFKMTRAGSVMQAKSNPNTTATQKSSTQRNAVADISARWTQDLDDAQRADWKALALANPFPNQWGDDFPLSAPAFFIKTNLNLRSVGAAEIDDAPPDYTVTAPVTVTLDVTAPNTAVVIFTTTPTPTNHRLHISATPAGNAGLEPTTQHYFFLTHGAAAEPSPFDVSAEYLANVGTFIVGKRYSISAALVNTTNGAKSLEISATTIAT